MCRICNILFNNCLPCICYIGHVHVPQETTQTSEGYYPAPKQFSSQPIPSFYIASNTDGPPPPYLAEYASDPPPVQQVMCINACVIYKMYFL